MFSADRISLAETVGLLDRQSTAGTQNKVKTKVDTTRPVARKHQLRRGPADGVAMNADG